MTAIASRLRWLVVFTSVALGLPAVAADEAEALTNEDILELTRAGVAGVVIVAKIAASAGDFDISTDALIALTDAGVDDAVLEAMARKPALRSARRMRHADFDGTPCEAPGIYLEEQGALIGIDGSRVERRTRRGVLSTAARMVPVVGVMVQPSRRARAIVRGRSATLRTRQSTPTFWFCFHAVEVTVSGLPTGSLNPGDFWLVALEAHRQKDERGFDLGKLDVWMADSSGPQPEQVQDIRYDRVKPHVFRATAASLKPGEYGFYIDEAGFFGAHLGIAGARLFAFGVDQSL